MRPTLADLPKVQYIVGGKKLDVGKAVNVLSVSLAGVLRICRALEAYGASCLGPCIALVVLVGRVLPYLLEHCSPVVLW